MSENINPPPKDGEMNCGFCIPWKDSNGYTRDNPCSNCLMPRLVEELHFIRKALNER